RSRKVGLDWPAISPHPHSDKEKYRRNDQSGPQSRRAEEMVRDERGHRVLRDGPTTHVLMVLRSHRAIWPQGSVLQQIEEIRGAERDFLQSANYKRRQECPQKWQARRPCRNQQQPGVKGRVPEAVNRQQVIEERGGIEEKRCDVPDNSDVGAAAHEYHAAQK